MDHVAGRPWKYEPLPSAERFHLDLGHTFKGFSGPVGSGKSYAFGYEALFQAYGWNPGLLGLIGAPTYPLLRDATKRTFLEILEIEEISYLQHKTENRITLLDNGSEIIFRSLDDFERLRGTNLAWFGVDELTYCKPEAWSRLEARLRHPQANRLCGFAAWTPAGYDSVYERFISSPKADYWAVLASPRENPHSINTGLYDRLAESYDDKLFRQEVLGEYLNVHSGIAYYAFNRAHNMQQLDYESMQPLIWSLDFNINPMCSVLAQVIDTTTRVDMLSGRRTGVIQVFDELYLADCNTPRACEEFHKKAQKFVRNGFQIQVNIYGDPAGSARQTAGSGADSDWQAVREFFSRHREYSPTFKYRNAHPPVRDRVAAVNGMLCNAEGQRKLFVDPRCKNLIRDLERVTWKEGAGILDKDDGALTHLSDALGYFVEAEFGLRPAGGYRSEYIA